MSGGVMLPPSVVALLIQTNRAFSGHALRDSFALRSSREAPVSDGSQSSETSSGSDRLQKSLDLLGRESRAQACAAVVRSLRG